MDMITLDRHDTGVAVITLNRADVLNSMNPQLLVEMRAALRTVRDDAAMGALVIGLFKLNIFSLLAIAAVSYIVALAAVGGITKHEISKIRETFA